MLYSFLLSLFLGCWYLVADLFKQMCTKLVHYWCWSWSGKGTNLQKKPTVPTKRKTHRLRKAHQIVSADSLAEEEKDKRVCCYCAVGLLSCSLKLHQEMHANSYYMWYGIFCMLFSLNFNYVVCCQSKIWLWLWNHIGGINFVRE